MDLNYQRLQDILAECPKETKIIELVGNDDYKVPVITENYVRSYIKRCLLLADKKTNSHYLAINPMGSHFTAKGKQAIFIYAQKHWDGE